MEKGKITMDQWKQITGFYNDQNVEGFLSFCHRHGLDWANMCRLLIVMEDVKSEMIKYGITMKEILDIDERFLRERFLMESDPAVKRIVKEHKINICELHTLYTKWYCVEIGSVRLGLGKPGWVDEYEEDFWFKLLCDLMGEDRMKELFKLYEILL
jgi:hypothetical protein